MGTSQLALALVIIAGLIGYSWWRSGRHGGPAGYMRRQLGLEDGEETTSLWTAFVDVDRSALDAIGEVLGARRRGISLIVALTNRDRLAIGRNEKRSVGPMHFTRGEVAVSLHSESAQVRRLAGPAGLERAHVGLLVPTKGGEPFRIQIAQSGLDELIRWSVQPA